MKTRYYFRKNGTDFFKWCRLVPRCKILIISMSKCSYSMLESNLVEYEEAKLILRQYKVLVSTLTEQERDLLKNYYVRGKFPADNTGYLFREIYKSLKTTSSVSTSIIFILVSIFKISLACNSSCLILDHILCNRTKIDDFFSLPDKRSPLIIFS